MTQTFTQTELIRLLYHELNPQKTAEVMRNIGYDEKFQAEFEGVSSLLTKLKGLAFEPEAETIAKILNYSSSYGK